MRVHRSGKALAERHNESFNGRFRDECLNMEWFRNRREAMALIETWRVHFNAVRPHSSLSYLTPNEFRKQCQSAQNPKHAGEVLLQ